VEAGGGGARGGALGRRAKGLPRNVAPGCEEQTPAFRTQSLVQDYKSTYYQKYDIETPLDEGKRQVRERDPWRCRFPSAAGPDAPSALHSSLTSAK